MTGTHLWRAGVTSPDARRERDFYPTPSAVVHVLIPFLGDFPRFVWDPACGDDSLAKALNQGFFIIACTDIVNNEERDALDFLATTDRVADAIITNPPYSLAEEFIRHAFKIGVTHMALLLKANFENAYRGGLFEEFPYAHRLPLTWRPDFTGKGRPFLDVTWYVWQPNCYHMTTTRLLRPGKEAA